MGGTDSRVILYDEQSEYYHVHNLDQLPPRLTTNLPKSVTMALYINGACRRTDDPNPIASYGVYFGPNSSFNRHGLLGADKPQTRKRADIEALWKALKVIDNETNRAFQHENNVLILTPSAYLCSVMTAWLPRWRENGGRTSLGERISHYDKLVEIDDLWEDLEAGVMDIGIKHIRGSDDRGATRLANIVLDEEERYDNQALSGVVARMLYQSGLTSPNRFSFRGNSNAWPFGQVVPRCTHTI